MNWSDKFLLYVQEKKLRMFTTSTIIMYLFTDVGPFKQIQKRLMLEWFWPSLIKFRTANCENVNERFSRGRLPFTSERNDLLKHNNYANDPKYFLKSFHSFMYNNSFEYFSDIDHHDLLMDRSGSIWTDLRTVDVNDVKMLWSSLSWN